MLDQEQVSQVIEPLISLCKTSQETLDHVPLLRDLVCMRRCSFCRVESFSQKQQLRSVQMRQLLCTVTAALQSHMEHERSHKLRMGPDSVVAKHLVVCRDLLLQGSKVLQSREIEERVHEH